MNLTRLDVAFDDHEGLLDIKNWKGIPGLYLL